MQMENEEYQIEKGNFTRISNALLENLIRLPFKGCELAVVMYIIRKTYGFHKKQDEISLSQFCKDLDRSRPTIVKALKNLQLVNMVKLVKRGSSMNEGNVYSLNKYEQEWQLVNTVKLVKSKPSTSKYGLTSTSKDGLTRSSKDGFTHKRKERNIKEIQKKVIKKSLVPEEPTATPAQAPTHTPSPSQIAKQFFGSDNMQQQALDWLSQKGIPEQVARSELQKFILYWTEPNKSGTKQRWELEKAFEINRRLATWFSRIKSNGHKPAERTRKIWTLD